ncbi:hypothetical protein BDZ97DRAFT_1762587 [Flammula alnicola]|nr:hypothetical protein BDZ97DRAFT_1762587 [Flammula alnicola]
MASSNYPVLDSMPDILRKHTARSGIRIRITTDETLDHHFKEASSRLVLAFDVGTTYSGISYSILDPGQVPETKGVTNGSSKIPTIIYHDRSGKVRAVGAEAEAKGIFEIAKKEKWVKEEWYAFHQLLRLFILMRAAAWNPLHGHRTGKSRL